MENSAPQNRKHGTHLLNRSSKIILSIGIILLIIGVVIPWFHYLKNVITLNKQPPEPRFEVGYFCLSLKQYSKLKKNAAMSGNDGNQLINYPVFDNEIALRINSNKPPLVPSYSVETVPKHLSEFLKAYKRKKLKPSISVTCLILKQTGKRVANHVAVDVDRVELKEVAEMYDDTDIGTENVNSQLYGSKNKVSKKNFIIESIDTGDGIIIPLYVCNYFANPDGGIGWRITSGVAYVPLMIRYRNGNEGPELQLPIRKVLEYPLNIFQ